MMLLVVPIPPVPPSVPPQKLKLELLSTSERVLLALNRYFWIPSLLSVLLVSKCASETGSVALFVLRITDSSCLN